MDILPREHSQHGSQAGYKVPGEPGGVRKRGYIIGAINRGFVALYYSRCVYDFLLNIFSVKVVSVKFRERGREWFGAS